jgi:hypothetical protein
MQWARSKKGIDPWARRAAGLGPRDKTAHVLPTAWNVGPIAAGDQHAPGATVEIVPLVSRTKVSRALVPVAPRDHHFRLEGGIPVSARFPWQL